MSFPPPRDVSGVSLSGTQPYTIDPEENRALCRSLGAVPDDDGRAHPIFYYIATQIGMRMTVAELCQACDFDVEDGPMMASSKVSFSTPLRVGQTYFVTGEILQLTRKASRRLGVMDMLEYVLRLSLPDGTPVLSATNLWVLPRRGLA